MINERLNERPRYVYRVNRDVGVSTKMSALSASGNEIHRLPSRIIMIFTIFLLAVIAARNSVAKFFSLYND